MIDFFLSFLYFFLSIKRKRKGKTENRAVETSGIIYHSRWEEEIRNDPATVDDNQLDASVLWVLVSPPAAAADDGDEAEEEAEEDDDDALADEEEEGGRTAAAAAAAAAAALSTWPLPASASEMFTGARLSSIDGIIAPSTMDALGGCTTPFDPAPSSLAAGKQQKFM